LQSKTPYQEQREIFGDELFPATRPIN